VGRGAERKLTEQDARTRDSFAKRFHRMRGIAQCSHQLLDRHAIPCHALACDRVHDAKVKSPLRAAWSRLLLHLGGLSRVSIEPARAQVPHMWAGLLADGSQHQG
jgi:hypothetical protein